MTLRPSPTRRIALSGRLDVTTVSDVRRVLHAALDDAGGEVVVDLSAVEVLDATGLGVLVGAHRRAVRAGGELVLVEVPARIQRLLTVTRLDRVIAVKGLRAA